MNLRISTTTQLINAQVKITGSKSETNRLLILQALYPNIKIENLSNSDDAQVMQKGLKVFKGEVDVHHAGTAMRFLTSFFAFNEGSEIVLTGSERMKERPIKILVEALNSLGAEISYLEQDGYPPLKILGKKIHKKHLSLPANISSQYISSLILNAPKLEAGLNIDLIGKITSLPYIKMSLDLLNDLGISTLFNDNAIEIKPQRQVDDQILEVESDWSSASYFYSIVALCELGTKITLSNFKKNSKQGDSVLAELYKSFGVETEYFKNAICLTKHKNPKLRSFTCHLNNAPDIAQTIAITCLGLGIDCHLTGLHTLKIKETDRLEALKIELSKLGAKIRVSQDDLKLNALEVINKNISIATYKDHRMAMAFAPLALRVPIHIENADVVSKSYPDFWNDLKKIGFFVESI